MVTTPVKGRSVPHGAVPVPANRPDGQQHPWSPENAASTGLPPFKMTAYQARQYVETDRPRLIEAMRAARVALDFVMSETVIEVDREDFESGDPADGQWEFHIPASQPAAPAPFKMTRAQSHQFLEADRARLFVAIGSVRRDLYLAMTIDRIEREWPRDDAAIDELIAGGQGRSAGLVRDTVTVTVWAMVVAAWLMIAALARFDEMWMRFGALAVGFGGLGLFVLFRKRRPNA